MSHQRLVWLDALRGFNILFMIGLSEVFNLAYHSEWNGLTFYDTIFPLFVFIAGLSIPLSLDGRRSIVESKSPIPHIIIRTVSLFFVGLMLNTIFLPSWFRIPGVLQRISICYFFSSIFYLRFPRRLWSIAALILMIYSGIMLGFGDLSPAGNLATKIDTIFFGGLDNEGILTTIPAIVTCLLGVITIDLVRRGKIRDLMMFGVILPIFGLLVNFIFPINKLLWSPSFVLINGSIDVTLVLIFFHIFENQRFRYLAFPLKVLGRNSIALYVTNSLFGFWIWSIGALGALIVKWLFALWLYRSRIFIKI